MAARTENTTLSTSALDDNALASIRQAIADFFRRCGAQYEEFVLDEALYTKCVQEAINRGIPTEGQYSILPFIAAGVACTATAYDHIPDHATWMWVCLLHCINIGIDDNLDGGQNMEHLCRFNERFVNCQLQGNPALQALDTHLREAPRHYTPLVSNLITTSILDYISSIMLDHETKGMEISTNTPSYPKYWRVLSGFPQALALMIFPSTLPVWKYVQSLPEVGSITDYVNDILSFYKEEIKGETANYISLVAASRGITKLDALRDVIDETVQAHHNILKSLKDHTDAYDAYIKFFHGYMRFHGVPRYKLGEVMGPRTERLSVDSLLDG